MDRGSPEKQCVLILAPTKKEAGLKNKNEAKCFEEFDSPLSKYLTGEKVS